MNQNPIFLVMRQFIAEGRLTGVTEELALDGIRFLGTGDHTVDHNPVEWNVDGTSIEVSKYGGQKIFGVEELRLESLQSGSPVLRQLGKELPQFFVRLNGAQLTPFQEYQARENHTVNFVLRSLIGQPQKSICVMQEYTARFFVKGTKDPEWRYGIPAYQLDYNSLDPANPIDAIPNHRICIQMWTPEEIVDWAKDWINTEYKARTGSTGVDFSPVREKHVG